jgi:hypothetical protein
VTENHRRERILTALVIIEVVELFVLAPLSVETVVPPASFVVILAINVGIVLAVVWHKRNAVIAVGLATLIEIAAVVLRSLDRTASTEILDACAVLLLLCALTVVLAVAVFGPGRVTVHRIVGAIAIYLNVGTAFALGYRVVSALGPGRFSPAAHAASTTGHALTDLIYFSFSTLTTTGYGDIVPIDPFARALANVESVIGQLFPATLLARLITLELEHRREKRDERAG